MTRIAAVLLFLALPLSAQTRYIVEFRGAQRFSDDLSALREDAPRMRVRHHYSRVLNGVAVEVADRAAADEIARLPYVERVSLDAIASAFENGSAAGTQGIASARAAAGTTSGKGVVVAVIDTGIDRNHKALAGKVIGGYDFANNDADPMDDHNHGTHVAGIIAASAVGPMTGVAPDVSLLAYKVLDARANGPTSNIIAGIERAVADGADVINISLGVPGHPDDPLARAVENAVAAGVVVCVAAGNNYVFHSVASPGVAHSAITVGATNDLGAMTDFSSRGPAARSGAIKPEIVAPGASILSTLPTGLYARLSGTSMSTPYVAGLAALLLEQHPDWTPARVKSALVNSAVPIANVEAMAQGAGRVDRARALASDVAVTPSQLNFGLDGTTAATWSSTRTISVRNESAASRTIRVNAPGLRVTPSSLTLAAGETRTVEVQVEIANATLGKPATASLAFDGAIDLQWDGGSARVPWAFLRAARNIVTYRGAKPEVLWGLGTRYGAIVSEPEAMVALLEPGTYDIVAVAAHDGDVRVFALEGQQIEGEVLHALTPELAPHEVRVEGVDERGQPLATPTYRAHVLLPDGPGVFVPIVHGRPLHASAFSDRFSLHALQMAYQNDTVYLVQHAVRRGISGHVTLRNAAGELAAQDVRIVFSGTRRDRTLVLTPLDWPKHEGRTTGAVPTLPLSVRGDSWTLKVMMTPEDGEHFVGALQIAVDRGTPSLIAPPLRRDAGGFFTSRAFTRPSIPTRLARGEVLELGTGTLHAAMNLQARPEAVTGEYDVRGSRGESRRDLQQTYRVYGSDGALVASGRVLQGRFSAMLPRAGAYRAEVSGQDVTSVLRFDTTRGAVALPTLTSLAVLDEEGRHATMLPQNGKGSLVFSTRGETPAVACKVRGTDGAGLQLAPVRVAEDPSYGFVYRVDLTEALRSGGSMEIAIDVADAAGNSATWIAPAFTTTAATGKRRAARH